jgi:hypothetical protein
MPDYRVLRHFETSERETLIAQVVAQIANSILHIRLPNRSFIEQVYGKGAVDFRRDEPVLGMYCLNCIYILRDLPDAELVRVTAHESRHAWQVQNQEYWDSFKLREYDANLFSREFAVYLGQPTATEIPKRLVTIYEMKCRELSPYTKDLILNKGEKNGFNKYQFES